MQNLVKGESSWTSVFTFLKWARNHQFLEDDFGPWILDLGQRLAGPWTLDRGWLVQGDVVMLAMFDNMFEMFKHT